MGNIYQNPFVDWPRRKCK